MPKSLLQAGLAAIRAAGDGTAFVAVASVDELPMAAEDETVTAVVHAEEYADAKLAAMRAHPTQITVDGPFFALSNNVGFEILAAEYYRQVRGPRGPVVQTGTALGELEQDLFAGLADAG